MSKGDANEFADILDRLRREFATEGELILPTPLGLIEFQHLTNLKGWAYELTTVGFPGVEPQIVAGGPPVVLADFTDEKGWVLSFTAVFRSPFGLLNFVADSHNFSVSPFFLNVGGQLLPNAQLVYNTVYNPATALGPAYGITYTPSAAIPYERLLRITLNLPLGVPVAATNVFAAGISRIRIIDEAIFLRSIKKFAAEQMIGRRLDRFP